MKLLFDHNLAPRLVIALDKLYPESQHVRELGMATASDGVIWNYAREQKMAKPVHGQGRVATRP